MSGKSITLAGRACSCDLPSTGSPPVCSLQPKVLAGRCSSSLALAATGTSGLGQHSGFPGMQGQQGQMPSRILALHSQGHSCGSRMCHRNPPRMLREGCRAACAQLAHPGSHSHSWHILPCPVEAARVLFSPCSDQGATAQRQQ